MHAPQSFVRRRKFVCTEETDEEKHLLLELARVRAAKHVTESQHGSVLIETDAGDVQTEQVQMRAAVLNACLVRYRKWRVPVDTVQQYACLQASGRKESVEMVPIRETARSKAGVCGLLMQLD